MKLGSRTIGFLAATLFAAMAWAQGGGQPAAPAAGRGQGGGRGPQVVSPEVGEDRRVTFRILAPQAESVKLSGSDIPGNGQGAAMTKGENGVWEVMIGPLDPGAYRYNFNVDGVSVVDPRNPAVSESNNNVWSLVYVPGADFMDTKDVPHGAVARRHLLLERARAGSAGCTSTRRRATRRARTSTRSSTCCTAPATATTRGPRRPGRLHPRQPDRRRRRPSR